MRRRFLVALTVFVLWAVGYLAYAISNSVRAAGPAEPGVREVEPRGSDDAGED